MFITICLVMIYYLGYNPSQKKSSILPFRSFRQRADTKEHTLFDAQRHFVVPIREKSRGKKPTRPPTEYYCSKGRPRPGWGSSSFIIATQRNTTHPLLSPTIENPSSSRFISTARDDTRSPDPATHPNNHASRLTPISILSRTHPFSQALALVLCPSHFSPSKLNEFSRKQRNDLFRSRFCLHLCEITSPPLPSRP